MGLHADYHSTGAGYDTASVTPRHPSQSITRLVLELFRLISKEGPLSPPTHQLRRLVIPGYLHAFVYGVKPKSSRSLERVLGDELALVFMGSCSCLPYCTALLGGLGSIC